MDFIPECKTSTPFEVGRKQYNLPYLVKSEKKKSSSHWTQKDNLTNYNIHS